MSSEKPIIKDTLTITKQTNMAARPAKRRYNVLGNNATFALYIAFDKVEAKKEVDTSTHAN